MKGINGAGRHYQYAGSTSGTMYDARDLCTDQGLTLATVIDDADKEAFKQTLMDAGQSPSTHAIYVLGLHDHETEGVWKWDDGTV